MADGYQGYNQGNYMRRKADIESDYAQSSTSNAYSRFLSQQRGSRALGDMSRRFGRAYPGARAEWSRRGMSGPGVRSGVQQQSMDRFLGDYMRDYGRTQQDVTQDLQQFDLNQQNFDAWRQQALAALEVQKRNEIANAAQNLEWLRGTVGGL